MATLRYREDRKKWQVQVRLASWAEGKTFNTRRE
jgi:hypothetical protein